VRLLLYGKWDHKDKEIRHFLQLLGSVDIEKTAQILCLRLKAYEKEDLEQEVRVAFLNTCRSSNSIRKHFRYTLQRRVVILLKDPLVYRQASNIPLQDEEDPIYRAPDIDDAWVAGYTCGPGFDELSVEERRILQLCKYYGFSIEHAATVMGKSTATISRAISRAKRVLSIHYLG
jgi:DNA-directed RNA polymerase specialized sigma subunit